MASFLALALRINLHAELKRDQILIINRISIEIYRIAR